MAKYFWQIKTADKEWAGTDSRVFLGLIGDENVMKEVPISDEKSRNNWERNDINSGWIETIDLGELRNATLRTDDSGAGASWWVDWLKVTDEDGREWTAPIGAEDNKGRYPLLRFSVTIEGEGENRQRREKAARDAQKRKRDEEKYKQQQKEDEARHQRELEEMQAKAERDLEIARQQAEYRRKQAEIDRLGGGGSGGGSGGSGGGGGGGTGLRTYEVFGTLGGANVPLSRVVAKDASGRFAVVAGGRVLVGDAPTDGFGLAGVPGQWAKYYPGQSPAASGLDADKAVLGWDGTRGWVLDAGFLTQIFGSGWRAAVY